MSAPEWLQKARDDQSQQQQTTFPFGCKVRIRDGWDDSGRIGRVVRFDDELRYDYQREMVLIDFGESRIVPGYQERFWFDVHQLEFARKEVGDDGE